jgi:GTPase
MSSPGGLPLIAVVGRPNVGKSTLFNRISGRRYALVSREPGMTRDRHFERAEWRGRQFEIVDTGGLQDDENPLGNEISTQAMKAVQAAALVLFVVDGREGLSSHDLEIATTLRRTGKPVFLLVNKIDTPQNVGRATDFHRLGFSPLFTISAEHGLDVDEVLDAAIEHLQLKPTQPTQPEEAIRVVILGKPNAGKSTLLNKLIGDDRLVTSELPGTTRDTIDLEIQKGQHLYRFVDTAGIRKKGATKTIPDKLAVIHARKSLEHADIACVMIDAHEGVTHQDAVITGYAWTAGRGLVLLFNKIDLLDSKEQKALEMEVDSKLQFISFAPRLYLSAKTGQNVQKLFQILNRVYEGYSKRVSTGQLNAFFDRALSNRYLGTYKGKPIKLKYITQTGVHPPTFVLFAGGATRLHFSHRRYLENQLRSHFGFEGAPIRIKVKRSTK